MKMDMCCISEAGTCPMWAAGYSSQCILGIKTKLIFGRPGIEDDVGYESGICRAGTL